MSTNKNKFFTQYGDDDHIDKAMKDSNPDIRNEAEYFKAKLK